jgi:hypothetical protein
VLTKCQPSTVWCSRERLPAAAAQPAKASQSCSATDYYYYYYYYYYYIFLYTNSCVDFQQLKRTKYNLKISQYRQVYRVQHISYNIINLYCNVFAGSTSRWNFITLKAQYTTVNYNQQLLQDSNTRHLS